MLRTKQPNSNGYVASLVVILISCIAAYLLVANKQFVLDQVSAWQYKPSSEVAAFADRTTMTDLGRFYFYASRPAVEEAQDFNTDCSKQEQNTAILGCYDGRNIYVYNVTNTQLDGIREVTAAHEMLHAAYDRMSKTERAQIDTLVEAEYVKLQDDKDFAERMAFYARTEPGERDNELHSVIGTEVSNLSPELEAHYKKYFADRAKIVSLHERYASVFTSLQTKSNELSDQLTALGNDIETSTAAYNNNVGRLNKDIAAFNNRANSGEFSDQQSFQAERTQLQRRAVQLDAQRRDINDKVAQYNNLRTQLLAIASQSDALNRSIDSSLAPAPSL
jgi:hypothetical protein